jgi:hypothetical protein
MTTAPRSPRCSTTGGGTPAGADPTLTPAVGLSEVEFCRYVLRGDDAHGRTTDK